MTFNHLLRRRGDIAENAAPAHKKEPPEGGSFLESIASLMYESSKDRK